ncbi:MAG: hypothetical protein KF819_27540 [Labilithrix sp.]|nr:hypothetical protein [Labilithrix sp.]
MRIHVVLAACSVVVAACAVDAPEEIVAESTSQELRQSGRSGTMQLQVPSDCAELAVLLALQRPSGSAPTPTPAPTTFSVFNGSSIVASSFGSFTIQTPSLSSVALRWQSSSDVQFNATTRCSRQVARRATTCTTTCQLNNCRDARGRDIGAIYVSGATSSTCKASKDAIDVASAGCQYTRHCSCVRSDGASGNGRFCEVN